MSDLNTNISQMSTTHTNHVGTNSISSSIESIFGLTSNQEVPLEQENSSSTFPVTPFSSSNNVSKSSFDYRGSSNQNNHVDVQAWASRTSVENTLSTGTDHIATISNLADTAITDQTTTPHHYLSNEVDNSYVQNKQHTMKPKDALSRAMYALQDDVESSSRSESLEDEDTLAEDEFEDTVATLQNDRTTPIMSTSSIPSELMLTPDQKHQLAQESGHSWSYNPDQQVYELPGGFYIPEQTFLCLLPHQRTGLCWFWNLHKAEGPSQIQHPSRMPPHVRKALGLEGDIAPTFGSGGILGDDMGMGKTVQTVAFLQGLFYSSKAKRVIVVSPVSVIPTWLNEFARTAPELNIQVLRMKRDRETLIDVLYNQGGILLVTYGLLRSACDILTDMSIKQMHKLRLETLTKRWLRAYTHQKYLWDYIIFDEGHKLKNRESQITRVARSIPVRHRILLTGTPLQNHIRELWCVFDFVAFGRAFGKEEAFRNLLGSCIVKGRDRDADGLAVESGARAARIVKRLIQPMYLRREKKQLMQLLNEFKMAILRLQQDKQQNVSDTCVFKTESDSNTSSATDQGKARTQSHNETTQTDQIVHSLEESMHRNQLANIELTTDDLENVKIPGLGQVESMIASLVLYRMGVLSMGEKKEIVVWTRLSNLQYQLYSQYLQSSEVSMILNKSASALAGLVVLKKICQHPLLLTSEELQQVSRQLQDRQMVETLQSMLEMHSSSIDLTDNHLSNNERTQQLVQASGKFIFLEALLKEFEASRAKVLVFSTYKKMLNVVQRMLNEMEIKYSRLDGDITSSAERQNIVNSFNSDASIRVCLLTTGVGSLGLTMTAATRVVILDPSWNPAVDEQAQDRAYRFGQRDHVVTYRIVTCGTIEEMQYRRQVFKGGITRSVTHGDMFTSCEPQTLEINDTNAASIHTEAQESHAYESTRFLSSEDLAALFTLGEHTYSETQRVLEKVLNVHLPPPVPPPEIQNHLQRLTNEAMLATYAGISHHDHLFRMFTEQPSPETAQVVQRVRALIQEELENNQRNGPQTPLSQHALENSRTSSYQTPEFSPFTNDMSTVILDGADSPINMTTSNTRNEVVTLLDSDSEDDRFVTDTSSTAIDHVNTGKRSRDNIQNADQLRYVEVSDLDDTMIQKYNTLITRAYQAECKVYQTENLSHRLSIAKFAYELYRQALQISHNDDAVNQRVQILRTLIETNEPS